MCPASLGIKEVREMTNEKDCCDIKIKRAKDGIEIKISGKDLERCLDLCRKNCCSDKTDKE